MSNDWYIEVGRQRMAEIAAGRAQAQADLELAKRDNDQYSAAAALQNIADIDQAQANLTKLYDQYLRSQTPPPPPSKQERLHREPSAMDWQDVVDLARQSKYAKDIQPNDPHLIAGWQEAQRRRARGE